MSNNYFFKRVFSFWVTSLLVSEADNRLGSPGHIHPQSNDRGMDRGEGQLLKLVSLIMKWSWITSSLLKVHLQVGEVADSWAGLK